MRTPSIYLETTIFNFPFAEDSPQYKADTLRLFAEIRAGKFRPFTSEYVVRELENTTDKDKLAKMKALISDYNITVLQSSVEAKRLADVYTSAGIIPKRYDSDALHLAAATIAGLDYVVSLNFKHIVKHKTMIETELINAREGFKRIFIHTPAEVIEYEEKS